VKLEQKLKELERKQKEPNYNPRSRPINPAKIIKEKWKPMKNRLADLGEYDQDKILNLFSDDLEKSVNSSLEKDQPVANNSEVQALTELVYSLKADLHKAHDKIARLEHQFKNEDEVNKILNSSFGSIDRKSLSFYAIQTRDAKSPNLPRNMTHMKGSNKQYGFSDHSDKIQESLKFYKYKNRSLQKNYDALKEKQKKVNKRIKELYSLNEKLINALKAQRSFEKDKMKMSGDKKTVTCKK